MARRQAVKRSAFAVLLAPDLACTIDGSGCGPALAVRYPSPDRVRLTGYDTLRAELLPPTSRGRIDVRVTGTVDGVRYRVRTIRTRPLLWRRTILPALEARAKALRIPFTVERAA